ncbi:hypothetical protein CVT26_007752 [Gymnopilus dilepis]|uniref:Uncharacterized protein n=1 Tax=Gymnopilus dilepis TaxID=231916 RepID=A0A409X151_9AGAR|nr:hypothetical protein CVT26_007752 [Gymnopilus dilepis]
MVRKEIMEEQLLFSVDLRVLAASLGWGPRWSCNAPSRHCLANTFFEVTGAVKAPVAVHVCASPPARQSWSGYDFHYELGVDVLCDRSVMTLQGLLCLGSDFLSLYSLTPPASILDSCGTHIFMNSSLFFKNQDHEQSSTTSSSIYVTDFPLAPRTLTDNLHLAGER